MSLQEKILKRIEVTSSGCWEWQGSVKSSGYGQIRNPETGRPVYVHRVMANAAQGDVVLHSCDNRKCCNPNHLSLGTQAENLADMASKGRGRKGHKLSDCDVLTIMSSSKKGYELAEEFGVSPATISMIRKGRTYGRLRSKRN